VASDDETVIAESAAPTVGTQDTLAAPHGRTDGHGHHDDEALVVPGQNVGRYSVLERLGAGGMGVVFAAYDPELDRRVAIKLLRPRPGHTAAADAQKRLLREARAMAKLTHPNVVTVHDAGEIHGSVFVAMEFVKGQTLKQWRTEKKRSLPETVDVFVRAGRGLAAAHAAGLVHRDFKPDNVMLSEDGRVLVLDFGLARTDDEQTDLKALPEADSIQSDDPRLTRTGAILGTPAYMSPEQHCGDETDARTDQFSFCVALWEAMYRQRPFEGETLMQLTVSVTRGDRRDPPADADVPARLRTIVERGLSVDRDGRWPSMDALLEALEHDPARARKRMLAWGAGAGLLALGVGGGMFASAQDAHAVDPCADVGADLEGVWDDGARQAAAAAFGESGGFTQVERFLDDYAEEWNRQRADLCQAQHAGSAGRLEDERMLCLEQRRIALDTAADAFAEGDPKVLEKAPRIASGLPRLDVCEDTAYLLARVKPPEDPAAAAQVESLREGLARAKALEWRADYDAALAANREIMNEAKSVGYAPLSAEVGYRIGVIQDFQSDYAASETELEACFFAAQSAGHHEAAADCAAKLVHVTADHLGRADDALRWGRHAEAAIAVGELEDIRRAILSNNLGNVLLGLDRDHEALAAYERALELWEAGLGDDHADLAIALGNIGRAREKLDDLDGAIQAQQRSLALREKHLGADHPHVSGSLHDLGVVLRKRNRLDEAQAAQRRALEIRKASLGADHPQYADTAAELGRTLLAAGQRDEAAQMFRDALAIARPDAGAEHVSRDEISAWLAAAEAPDSPE
jgi:tetratricopeptide (TPR) repeat protein/aminoglycoside phosphotransferase (APT) family kinase protein